MCVPQRPPPVVVVVVNVAYDGTGCAVVGRRVAPEAGGADVEHMVERKAGGLCRGFVGRGFRVTVAVGAVFRSSVRVFARHTDRARAAAGGGVGARAAGSSAIVTPAATVSCFTRLTLPCSRSTWTVMARVGNAYFARRRGGGTLYV